MELFCDNKLAIAIAKNSVFHNIIRHIAMKYHFIREAIDNEEIQLKYCKSKEQVANILAKALPKEKFLQLRELLGVKEHHIRGKC